MKLKTVSDITTAIASLRGKADKHEEAMQKLRLEATKLEVELQQICVHDFTVEWSLSGRFPIATNYCTICNQLAPDQSARARIISSRGSCIIEAKSDFKYATTLDSE